MAPGLAAPNSPRLDRWLQVAPSLPRSIARCCSVHLPAAVSRTVHPTACLPICLSVCLSACLPVCLPAPTRQQDAVGEFSSPRRLARCSVYGRYCGTLDLGA